MADKSDAFRFIINNDRRKDTIAVAIAVAATRYLSHSC